MGNEECVQGIIHLLGGWQGRVKLVDVLYDPLDGLVWHLSHLLALSQFKCDD